MKHHTAVLPFIRSQHGTMPTPRGLLHVLLVTLCLSLVQPFAAVAQANAPAPLPPAAQEALNKGIIAAKVPDYLLAIRYFEEARKLAPQAPVVYLNMGLAESRIPGRELRAMAWFGAYLAAHPDAPNAAAVKEQIGVLEVRNQSNISRLIKAVQDAADQIKTQQYSSVAVWVLAGDIRAARKIVDLTQDAVWKSRKLSIIAKMQVEVGDIVGARKTTVEAQRMADLVQDAAWKNSALARIAEAQADVGDIAEAQKTADLVQNATWKGSALAHIAEAQAKAGDIAEAQKTADLVQDAAWKDRTLARIAKAQAKGGDFAGAQKTADLVQNATWKSSALARIAEAQAKAGDFAGAQKTVDLLQDAGWKSSALARIAKVRDRSQANIGVVNTKVSDWLDKLDDEDRANFCPLNTGPFLDLAGYLKSLPQSEDPLKMLASLHETAEKIARAQNIITGMLKQQAKR